MDNAFWGTSNSPATALQKTSSTLEDVLLIISLQREDSRFKIWTNSCIIEKDLAGGLSLSLIPIIGILVSTIEIPRASSKGTSVKQWTNMPFPRFYF